jgi:hypothetical protein
MKASLSRALLKLGKREKNLATLRDARKAAENAIEVFVTLKATQPEAEARETLASINQTIKNMQ